MLRIVSMVHGRLRAMNQIRSADLCFVGYPKTGNTWLRYMLGCYVKEICGYDSPVLFDETDWLGRTKRYCIGRTITFTHHPLTWVSQTADDLDLETTIGAFRGKDVVLLVRNPLDALISLMMQLKHRGDTSYDGTAVQFLDHHVYGIEKLFKFYDNWQLGRDQVRSFTTVRYEDLKKDPNAVLARILNGIGIITNEEAARRAVAAASFENMRKLEISDQPPRYASSGSSIFATGDRGNAEALHLRRGEVGGYRRYLDEQCISRHEESIKNRMSWLLQDSA